MKKLFTILVALSFAGSLAFAQDKQVFNHLAVGVTTGMDGVGLEVATTLTPFVQVRGGYSLFPYTYKTTVDMNLDLGDGEQNYRFPLSATLWNGGTGKLLFDIYPGKKTPFHFTFGAYVGAGKLVHASGDVSALLDPSDYANTEVEFEAGSRKVSVTTDQKGFVNVDVLGKNGAFLPYAGIGFGRAIKPDSRVRVSFDMGALFTGGYKLQTYNYSRNPKGEPVVLDPAMLVDQDGNTYEGVEIIDKISSFPVFPMLKLNIFVRIF